MEMTAILYFIHLNRERKEEMLSNVPSNNMHYQITRKVVTVNSAVITNLLPLRVLLKKIIARYLLRDVLRVMNLFVKNVGRLAMTITIIGLE